MKNRKQHHSVTALASGLWLLVACQPAAAMQALSNQAMSQVTGQDGLTLNIKNANGITATEVRTIFSPADSDFSTVAPRVLSLRDVSLKGKSGNPLHLKTTLDVSTFQDGTPALAITTTLENPARLMIDSQDFGDGTGGNTLGTMALDAQSATFTLVNAGLFSADIGHVDNSTNKFVPATHHAYLLGEINDGALFYRQSSSGPYMVMDNLHLRWEIPNGVLGIIGSPISVTGPVLDAGGGDVITQYLNSSLYGIYMATGDSVLNPNAAIEDTIINVDMGYNWAFNGDDSTFVSDNANDLPFLYAAWDGSLKDARLIWQAEDGIQLASRWNFVSAADATAIAAATGGSAEDYEFVWHYGSPGDNGMGIEFADWRNMPGVKYGHWFPYIGITVVDGTGGDGSLLWKGAGAPSITPGTIQTYGSLAGTGHDALALEVRDGNLLAYSNRVKILDGNGDVVKDGNTSNGVEGIKDWALVNTLSNVYSKVYLYPTNGNGIVMDVGLVTQSLDSAGNQEWLNDTNKADVFQKGSNLMIGDTSACATITCPTGDHGLAIGMMGVNFMLMANDARMTLVDGTGTYDKGIDLLIPQFRVYQRGTFGGATFPNAHTLVRASAVEWNLEGMINLRLSPSVAGCGAGSNPDCFLGFSGVVRLYDISQYNSGTTGASFAGGQGSYIALAEVQAPDKPYKLGDISGDFALTNGKVQLHMVGSGANRHSQLNISNDILFGTTASTILNARAGDVLAEIPGSSLGEPFVIGNVSAGGNSFGSVVIPSGQWHFSAALYPQSP